MGIIPMYFIKNAIVTVARKKSINLTYCDVDIAWISVDGQNLLFGFIVPGQQDPKVDSVALYTKGRVYLLENWADDNAPVFASDCPNFNWVDENGNHVELPSLA